MPDAQYRLLAIDPGRHKCGLAVLHHNGEIVLRQVVATSSLPGRLREMAAADPPAAIVVGNRTGHEPVAQAARNVFPDLPLELVDEHRTSEQARVRYWQAHPPRGWRRLLPLGLQTPPVEVDDWVAVILGERYLQARER